MKSETLCEIVDGMDIIGIEDMPFFKIKRIVYDHIENARVELQREARKEVKVLNKISSQGKP